MSKISQDSQHFIPNMQTSYLTNNNNTNHVQMDQSYGNIGSKPSGGRSPMGNAKEHGKQLQSTANTSGHTATRLFRQDSSDHHL